MFRLSLLVIIIYFVVGGQTWSDLDVPNILLACQINRAWTIEKYVSCAVDQGPGDDIGNDLKPIMFDLVTTQTFSNCQTNREKRNFRYLLKTMHRQYLKCWQVMTVKFVRRRNLNVKGCTK